jgi:hypothetical protein
MPDQKKLNDKELVELGTKLQEFYELGYINRRRALGFSLMKGMATGLGVFIGGTLAVTVILWILTWFETYPLIGPIRGALEKTVGN